MSVAMVASLIAQNAELIEEKRQLALKVEELSKKKEEILKLVEEKDSDIQDIIATHRDAAERSNLKLSEQLKRCEAAEQQVEEQKKEMLEMKKKMKKLESENQLMKDTAGDAYTRNRIGNLQQQIISMEFMAKMKLKKDEEERKKIEEEMEKKDEMLRRKDRGLGLMLVGRKEDFKKIHQLRAENEKLRIAQVEEDSDSEYETDDEDDESLASTRIGSEFESEDEAEERHWSFHTAMVPTPRRSVQEVRPMVIFSGESWTPMSARFEDIIQINRQYF